MVGKERVAWRQKEQLRRDEEDSDRWRLGGGEITMSHVCTDH